jgi:hypothetical protein
MHRARPHGGRLDDCKVNLRFVTASESSANVKGRASSGYRGVYPMRSKWQARAKQAAGSIISAPMTPLSKPLGVAHLWRLENLPGYTGRDIAA